MMQEPQKNVPAPSETLPVAALAAEPAMGAEAPALAPPPAREPPAAAPRATIDPRPGQMVDCEVTTEDPVFRFSTRQRLVTGEPICWNDYYFYLWRSGCIRPLALAEPAHG